MKTHFILLIIQAFLLAIQSFRLGCVFDLRCCGLFRN